MQSEKITTKAGPMNTIHAALKLPDDAPRTAEHYARRIQEMQAELADLRQIAKDAAGVCQGLRSLAMTAERAYEGEPADLHKRASKYLPKLRDLQRMGFRITGKGQDAADYVAKLRGQ